VPTSSSSLAIAVVLIGIVCVGTALAGVEFVVFNIKVRPPTSRNGRLGLGALGGVLLVAGGTLLWASSRGPNTRFRVNDIALVAVRGSYDGRCGKTLTFVGRIGVAGQVPGEVTYLFESRGGRPASQSLAKPIVLPFISDTALPVSIPLIVQRTGKLSVRVRIVAPGGKSTSEWATTNVTCQLVHSSAESVVSERRLTDVITQTTGLPSCLPMASGCVQEPSKCTPAYCRELRLNVTQAPATLRFYQYYDYIWFFRGSTTVAFLAGLRYTEHRTDPAGETILVQRNGEECNAGFVHKNVVFLWALGSCRNSLRAGGAVGVGPAAQAMLQNMRRL
jgi:hypothetical protein